ncbi:hypothetical protein SBA2_100041 [Acidobacteriia bacterium SbA2]|nr:hypothetical protein SBA2_100041 [Acidobacteriia bacterium SbA2]
MACLGFQSQVQLVWSGQGLNSLNSGPGGLRSQGGAQGGVTDFDSALRLCPATARRTKSWKKRGGLR